jgi:serine/threonine-protein kinase
MAEPPVESIGRYKVLGVLGKGAMGVVYKAIDPMIDREVAIKTIKLSLSEEELALYEARFAQEIKTVGKLNHPHIVPIYDVGRTDQFAYMAMEFIDGRELKAYMTLGKPMDVSIAIDLIAQVADGLAFAHAREIVHRDVKPSNVMIAETDEGLVAKVMDFGIARAPSSSVKTMTGMILGSPRYMSPEQVVGKKIGPQSDIFSLGVVLYEMLTGTAPFDADSVSSIMYQTVHVRENPVSNANPKAPPPLDLIVAKALAKSLDERYATMKEFYRALREAQKILPAPAASAEHAPAAGSGAISSLRTVAAAEGERENNVSKDFDSTTATMRLAAMTEEAGELTMMLKKSPLVAPAKEPEPLPPLKPPGNTTGAFAPAPRASAPSAAFPVMPAVLLGSLATVALALGVALLL